MDAERELKADKALRDLFQEVGHQEAPIGVDARIMQRIVVAVPAHAKPESSLIPPFAWMATGGVLIASIAWLLANSGAPDGTSYLESLLNSLPRISVSDALSSPWMMMGGVSLVALLGLDALLTRRTLALRSKG